MAVVIVVAIPVYNGTTPYLSGMLRSLCTFIWPFLCAAKCEFRYWICPSANHSFHVSPDHIRWTSLRLARKAPICVRRCDVIQFFLHCSPSIARHRFHWKRHFYPSARIEKHLIAEKRRNRRQIQQKNKTHSTATADWAGTKYVRILIYGNYAISFSSLLLRFVRISCYFLLCSAQHSLRSEWLNFLNWLEKVFSHFSSQNNNK